MSMDNMDNSPKEFGLKEEKQIGGLVVRRKKIF